LKWLLFVASVAICSVIIVIAINYEQRQYDAANYTNTVDIISPVIHSYNCSGNENTGNREGCEENQKLVMEWATSIHNLAAQETMASATRGLLWVGGLQAIASFLTLGFLLWTVYQTKLILDQTVATTKSADATLAQANETTKLTQQSLDVTKQVASYEMKPYLSFEFLAVDCWRVHADDQWQIRIDVRIKNKGLTPASYVVASFNRKHSHIFCKRIGPVRKSYPEITLANIHSPDRSTDYMIPAHSEKDFVFCGMWHFYPDPFWIRDMDLNRDLSKICCLEIRLAAFEIRYKDLTCEDTANHVLMDGDISVSFDGTSNSSVRGVGVESDNENDYYKRYVEIANQNASRYRRVPNHIK
jgi:hypothetical protein